MKSVLANVIYLTSLRLVLDQHLNFFFANFYTYNFCFYQKFQLSSSGLTLAPLHEKLETYVTFVREPGIFSLKLIF